MKKTLCLGETLREQRLSAVAGKLDSVCVIRIRLAFQIPGSKALAMHTSPSAEARYMTVLSLDVCRSPEPKSCHGCESGYSLDLCQVLSLSAQDICSTIYY